MIITLFWNAFVLTQQCAIHVELQLLNERTRVMHFLGAIIFKDLEFQAVMALVRNDAGTNGEMNDFEAMASSLLP